MNPHDEFRLAQERGRGCCECAGSSSGRLCTRARLCMDVRVHGHQRLEAFGCEEVGWAPLASIGQLHSGQPRRGCVFTCASLLCGLTHLHVIGKLSLFL